VISEFNEFSDHAPVHFTLTINTNADCTLGNNTATRRVLAWDTEHIDVYRQQLSACMNDITGVIDGATVDNVNETVDMLSVMIYDIGFNLFGKVVHTSVDGNRRKINKNEWFDDECRNAKRVFQDARNAFSHVKNDVNKARFVQCRSAYTRVKRRAKSGFRSNQGKQLCHLAKANPRSF
jgi:hypothetical protein